ncbi:hypothetical protein [Streptomyces sp. NPDC087294]|uniref:hypothetical protein n=1 Tax=Streptomyces sp. NPDC087294 TaxID=3365777 RepID=UPI0037FB6C66
MTGTTTDGLAGASSSGTPTHTGAPNGKQALTGLFDRSAPHHDRAVMEHIADLGHRLLAHTHLDAVQGVLDVGCGPGAALLPAARAVGPNGQATGVNPSAW